MLKVETAAIENGIILDAYGKRGDVDQHGIPQLSWPLTITDTYKDTACFAIFLEDRDAIPVCGYSWIHWCAANIPKTGDKTVIKAGATRQGDFVEGLNSWAGKIANVEPAFATGYGGMAPPDRPHTYRLVVYALDQQLSLTSGFYANEILALIEAHVLNKIVLTGQYSNK